MKVKFFPPKITHDWWGYLRIGWIMDECARVIWTPRKV